MAEKYQFKTEPWGHQREAMRRAWRLPGFAYLMEMGTGKSKVAVDEAGLYFENGMIDTWIVMAPKGVYRNWTRPGGEIDTHLPERIRARADIVVWEAGGGTRANQHQLERLLEPSARLRVLVMNTEAVSSPGLARTYLLRFLRSGRALWDLDESTFIKTPTSKRTKFLLEAAPLAAYRRIMTGSPVTRSPSDLWAQFEFVAPRALGHRSFYAFRARYSVLRKTDFGGKLKRPIEIEVAHRNLDELTARMEPLSYRVRKDECLDLPPKVYQQREVELTPEQRKIYDDMVEYSIAELDSGGFASSQHAITRLMSLSRIVCGHVRDADGCEHDIPTNRIDGLVDVLQEASGKVIVWSRFRRDIQKIAERLGRDWDERRVAQYHGGNTSTRQEDVRRFLEDDDCWFMLSNQQAGGYGNTWIVATTSVYFSNDYDLTNRIQSEDRNHRGGQTDRVNYVDLVARGTVDEKHVDALVKKLDVASIIVGDQLRDWLRPGRLEAA